MTEDVHNEPESTASGVRLDGGQGPVWMVLGGGGLKGVCHVGAWRALLETDVRIAGIVGTSIGSLIGAMLTGSSSVAEIEERLPGLAKDDYFRLNFAKFLRKGLRAPSMYSGETFRRSLEKLIGVRSFLSTPETMLREVKTTAALLEPHRAQPSAWA